MPRNHLSITSCCKCLAPKGTATRLRPGSGKDMDEAVAVAVCDDTNATTLATPTIDVDAKETLNVSNVAHVRNVAVIAHVDHGKTTLSDALITRAGLLNSDKAGDQDTGRSLDTTKEERERGITIKATGITLDYELDSKILQRAQELAAIRLGKCNDVKPHGDTALSPFSLNLIDSPGHVDFSGEVSSALRMTDGALLVVDVVAGKSSQTDTVVLQAIQERVRLVLMLNKVDRLILEKQLTPEAVYDRFIEVIAQINDTISAHLPSDQPELLLSLESGNVAFGSGYFQWSATVGTVADMMKPELASSKRSKFMKTLAKKENFVKGILDPIFRVHDDLGLLASSTATNITACLGKFNERMQKLGRQTKVKADEVSSLPPRKVLKKLMSIFLPAADPLLAMIAMHLPSPVEAMPLRTSYLYEKKDGARDAMSRCADNGATVVFVSKMVHPGDVGSKRGGLVAVSRVFAGTIKAGDSLMVAGTSTTVKVGSVQQCVGKNMITIGTAHAGQIVALTGISGGIHKNGTLVSSLTFAPIKGMQFSVSPIVQKAISPVDSRQLKKMVAMMKEIVQADQTALFYQHPETMQYVLAGAGELHLEVLLHSLDERGVRTKVSDPMVNFREGITEPSTGTALKKTSNKLNRLWFRAEPLSDELVEALESQTISSDPKLMAQELISRHGWDKTDAHRVWRAGPEIQSSSGPTCLLVNATVGLQIPNDVRDSIIAAFEGVVREGVLAGSQLRGVRFDLVDAKFHSESTHRSSPQMLPAAKSAMRGAFMLSQPCLIEPYFNVEVTGNGSITNAYNVLGKRRAQILEETISEKTGMIEAIKAKLPVRMSFGILDDMRQETSGRAFVTNAFGGWGVVSGDPADPSGGESRSLVVSERKLKRLHDTVPVLKDFVDKL